VAGYSVTFSVVDQATRQLDQINRRITQMRAPLERMAKTTSKFIDVSGLKKISDGFQWIARSAGSALSVLTGVVPVLGVLTSAATIAGMTKLVGTFANWGNQLRTNADQIGITAQQLQLWEDATQRAGGSAADMTETLKNLHKISADAFTGMDNEALSYFRRFNISLTDANGKLRSATDLLPEVFRALDSLKDPADRARVAAALLGDSQAKLYEEYKQSGQPLEHWLDLERQHKQLTDDQLNALNQYRLAQAGLGTTFENLGRQISVVLATHFTPLLQHLDEFVQKHQPQIIAAIDHLATKFAEWLDNITWDDVENGLTRVCSALVWVSNHLDDIARVAEAIAALFAVKWAVNIVSAIATVTSALGSLGAGAAGAVGGRVVSACLARLVPSPPSRGCSPLEPGPAPRMCRWLTTTAARPAPGAAGPRMSRNQMSRLRTSSPARPSFSTSGIVFGMGRQLCGRSGQDHGQRTCPVARQPTSALGLEAQHHHRSRSCPVTIPGAISAPAPTTPEISISPRGKTPLAVTTISIRTPAASTPWRSSTPCRKASRRRSSFCRTTSKSMARRLPARCMAMRRILTSASWGSIQISNSTLPTPIPKRSRRY